MILTSFTQSIYPKQQVINGDTVVLFEPVQLKYINRKILTVDYLTMVSKGLSLENKSLQTELCLTNLKVESLASQVDAFSTAASAYSNIIQNKDSEIKLIKKQNKKKVRNTLILSGASGVVIGLIISILI